MEEEILSKIKELSKQYPNIDDENKMFFSASYISQSLNLKRNTASYYLNLLFRKGKVVKTKTRPVYFYDAKKINGTTNREFQSLDELKIYITDYNNPVILKEGNSFSNIIGSDYSIRRQIDMLKAAILYPPNGLPILIQGETGTGKSMLSEIVYEYSKEVGVIDENAPYLSVNCSQYADNKELLSAYLFGYKKGAFTGAMEDTPGAIENANNGILFLDEAHRLDSTGQEKLFTFLDKGTYSRIGESRNIRKAKVRIIFATTETINDTFISTFLRRIPIIIQIPSLKDRRLDDKKTLIHMFFGNEAKRLNVDIYVSKAVLNFLMQHEFKGNIGELKKLITIICATAYNNYMVSYYKEKIMEIRSNLLPIYLLTEDKDSQEKYYTDGLFFKKDIDKIQNITMNIFRENPIYDLYENIFSIFKKYKNGKIKVSSFEELLKNSVESCFKDIIYSTRKATDYRRKEYLEYKLKDIHKEIADRYGFELNSGINDVIVNYIYYREGLKYIIDRDPNLTSQFLNYILINHGNDYKKSTKIIISIIDIIDYPLDRTDAALLSVFIPQFYQKTLPSYKKVLVISEGKGISDTICNIGNNVMGNNLFIPIEASLGAELMEIVQLIACTINNYENIDELLIVVDVVDIDALINLISDFISCSFAVISNVTIFQVKNICNRLKKNDCLKNIVKDLSLQYGSIYRFINK